MNWLWTIIWIVLVAAAVIWAWRTGQLMRIGDYCRETSAELKKCSWPSWNELKGSTVVVMVSIFCLGALTVGCDFLWGFLVPWLTGLFAGA